MVNTIILNNESKGLSLHNVVYISGHSDVLMGVACTNDDKIAEKFRFMQKGECN